MTCNQICQYNEYGASPKCLKTEEQTCPMFNAYHYEAQEAKADAGKLQIHMVPMQIVRDCAEVRMYGTEKYGDENNWKKVELIRYIDAMLRHTLAFVEDIHSVDAESGIPHYKHAECNWSFISQLMYEGKCPPKMERDADGRVCGETPAAARE